MARLRLSEQVLLDARGITGPDADALDAEAWASRWLGEVWRAAPLGETEPEHLLCTEVAGRATARHSDPAMAAVAALERVAPVAEREMLAQAVDILSSSRPRPAWASGPAWEPVAAFRGADVWLDERVLFVEYSGAGRPHTLMAVIADDGDAAVGVLRLVEPGTAARWEELRAEHGDVDDTTPPMPIAEAEPSAVLAELAMAMRETDLVWPRDAEGDYSHLRALAWTRCRDDLAPWPDWTPTASDERDRLTGEFAERGGLPYDDVTRSLAGLFLDYGDGYIRPGPLAWSPGRVALFLADHLPRKVVLDAEQRERLPSALRAWVRFALEKRGLEPRWIEPVEEAVKTYHAAFEKTFDDESAWGPAKRIVSGLTERHDP
ncbi:hypothetical protein [Spongiactinospora sp. TRM90649]|uniref:hypothetical protein n=1 Tax=Spongiactinospora sp. TRM90649 TaxID=3031114 RepID=UPI0023F851C4|nr:hypothetical protein [Spongiactinospora sp. TRM90649]MDF5758190.1 hypothetical protein [Spongiactinospora sp. TRM90649]